eukprot:m.311554 g.311554  ORF g.311554 m.311554 type:complete len:109 (-) comp27881_c0_seq1:405-731(-)
MVRFPALCPLAMVSHEVTLQRSLPLDDELLSAKATSLMLASRCWHSRPGSRSSLITFVSTAAGLDLGKEVVDTFERRVVQSPTRHRRKQRCPCDGRLDAHQDQLQRCI